MTILPYDPSLIVKEKIVDLKPVWPSGTCKTDSMVLYGQAFVVTHHVFDSSQNDHRALPSSFLTVVSIMVRWESNQWHEKNIFHSVSKRKLQESMDKTLAACYNRFSKIA